MTELTEAERKALDDFMWAAGDVDEEGDQVIRHYDTPADLHAVYSAIVRKGEWDRFMNFANMTCRWDNLDPIRDNVFNYFTAWLFCLASPDYEERCQMVADWLWKEASND